MRYLVSYDLRNPGRNYDVLYTKLGAFGAKRVLLSDWVFRRQGTNAAELREYFKQFIDSNDRLLILSLDSSDWAGWNLLSKPSQM